MKFKLVHNNINVRDLDKSLAFYEKALGMHEVRRKEAKDSSFILVYLETEGSTHQLELTWLHDWDRPYNLGDNEFHIAFETEEFEKAHAMHKEMGCIVYENEQMGIYFIADPDGYWLEVLPVNLK